MPKITVLHKNPGADPTTQQIDRDDIADLQKLVGGYFEAITVQRNPDVVLWCNEDARRLNLAPNLRLGNGAEIMGMIVLAGRLGPDLTDLPNIEFWQTWLADNAITFEDDFNCMGCGLRMTPSTTDWAMFRQGLQVHDALPCLQKLDAKLAAHGGTPSV